MLCSLASTQHHKPSSLVVGLDLGERVSKSYRWRGQGLLEQSGRVKLALQQDWVGWALNHHILKHELIQIY